MKKTFDKAEIAQRIQDIRKHLNMKSKHFAESLGVSGPSQSELENGKYLPNFEYIANLMIVFNVNLYYLFFGEGKMFEETPQNADIMELEKLAESNKDIGTFLYYFERSNIIRYYILSEFSSKFRMEQKLIEQEAAEYSKQS